MILKRSWLLMPNLPDSKNPQIKKFEKTIDYVLYTCYYKDVPNKGSFQAEIRMVLPIIFRASRTDIFPET